MSHLLHSALAQAKLDILLLGALANRLRQAERGDVVRIWLDEPPPVAPGEEVAVRSIGRAELEAFGGERHFARAIAELRIAGPARQILRIDVASVGLPLAQLALAFGADEWVAPLHRVQLEVYEEALPLPGRGPQDAEAAARNRAVLRERELANLVRNAGREPRIVQVHEGRAQERAVDTTSKVHHGFRAPGREQKERLDRPVSTGDSVG